jgi:transcriptional antiterminator RfaH
LQHGDFENQTVDRWYLAYTQPRQETVSPFNLEQQGFEAYWPLLNSHP